MFCDDIDNETKEFFNSPIRQNVDGRTLEQGCEMAYFQTKKSRFG
jgi:hypothetical protein